MNKIIEDVFVNTNNKLCNDTIIDTHFRYCFVCLIKAAQLV